MDCCKDVTKWTWFNQYCLAARMAKSLQNRTPIPAKLALIQTLIIVHTYIAIKNELSCYSRRVCMYVIVLVVKVTCVLIAQVPP